MGDTGGSTPKIMIDYRYTNIITLVAYYILLIIDKLGDC